MSSVADSERDSRSREALDRAKAKVVARLGGGRVAREAALRAARARATGADSVDTMFEYRPENPFKPSWEAEAPKSPTAPGARPLGEHNGPKHGDDGSEVPPPQPALMQTQQLPRQQPPPKPYRSTEGRGGLTLSMPDWKRAQPGAAHAAPVKDAAFEALAPRSVSFDCLHPALADEHFLRTDDHEEALAADKTRRGFAVEAERKHIQRMRDREFARKVYHEAPRGGQREGTPTDKKLRQLQREGQRWRREAAAARQRAGDAIEASQRATRRASREGLAADKAPGAPRSPAAGLESGFSARIGDIKRRIQLHAAEGGVSSSRAGSSRHSPSRSRRRTRVIPMPESDDPRTLADFLADQARKAGDKELADILAKIVALSRQGEQLAQGDIDEDETVTAEAKYVEERAREYLAELDEAMRRRRAKALASGDPEHAYNSDEEREKDAEERERLEQELAKPAEQRDAERIERLIREEEEALAKLENAWEKQDAWMDAYRNQPKVQVQRRSTIMGRLSFMGGGSSHGASPQRQARPSEAWALQSPRPTGAGAATLREVAESWEPGSPARDQGGPSKPAYIKNPNTTDLDEELRPFVPQYARATYEHGVVRPGEHTTGLDIVQAFKEVEKPPPTVPKPFSFELREKKKSIMQARLEQDLEVRRQEELRASQRTFRANDLPASTTEPRFEAIMVEQEVKRATQHQRSLAKACGIAKPFAFEEREREREAARAAAIAAARDPNRFQRRFKANPIPASIREERYGAMVAGLEERKQALRQRAEAKLAASRMPPRLEQYAQQEAAERAEAAADAAAAQRARRVSAGGGADPKLWKKKHMTRKMGSVPDFQRLQAEFAAQLAHAKARNAARQTVPRDFALTGATAEEREAARAADAERRRRRHAHDDKLRELRWPYASTREKVRPTPPPAEYGPTPFRVSDTRANVLRRERVKDDAERGRYMEAEERLAADRARYEREMEARRRAYLRMKAARDKADAADADADEAAGLGGVAEGAVADAAGADRALAWQKRQHEAVRRQEGQDKAKEGAEEALLDAGMEAYRYVEGVHVSRVGQHGAVVGSRDAVHKVRQGVGMQLGHDWGCERCEWGESGEPCGNPKPLGRICVKLEPRD
ncbi:unnamed protein product [Pedinophyceae sp. YPF-701]|nr:unnamed protein product [Pedinophyceae sp. YPF-701]